MWGYKLAACGDWGPWVANDEDQPPPKEEALERLYPLVVDALRDAGFDAPTRKSWIELLVTLAESEQEMLALIDEDAGGVAPATRSYVRRELTLFRHALARWWNHGNPIWRLIYTVGWFTLLLSPLHSMGWSPWLLPAAVMVVIAKIRFILSDADPSNMRLLQRGYDERKLLFRDLLETQQLWSVSAPSEREVARFRQEALALIALYMRDHRSDIKGRGEIFANLLITTGSHIVVVARSERDRPVPAAYAPEDCQLVHDAIHDERTQVTGDLYVDFPRTRQGKRYSSVLALPVRLDGKVLGAVSIDSVAKYHFDRHFDDLEVHLGPYIQLLAVTLTGAYGTDIQTLAGGACGEP